MFGILPGERVIMLQFSTGSTCGSAFGLGARFSMAGAHVKIHTHTLASVRFRFGLHAGWMEERGGGVGTV